MAMVVADGSSVTLTGLSFTAATVSFNVYRGHTPSNLHRIATGQAIAISFTDGGLVDQLIPSPIRISTTPISTGGLSCSLRWR